MRLALGSLLLAAGCATIDYDSVDRGRFQGSAIVVWVGPGDRDILGDGKFLYVPVRGRELVFTRPSSSDPSGGSGRIQPEAFYTDGGSIPRSVQWLRGFNAWGYGPAYIIHDWLFVARKCLNDAETDGDLITDEMRKISKVTFRESALIMAETIRTLVDDYDIGGGNEVSGPTISNVTAGPISYDLWTEKGKCRQLQVTDPDHLNIIADLQSRQSTLLSKTALDSIRSAPLRLPGGPPYQIVGTYNFN